MSLDQCERDAMLGKKVRELLKRPQEYRDGYVDGWVDMENEYRTQQATIERLERLRSAWKEETDRLNTDNHCLSRVGKEQEQVIKGLRTQNLHLSCQLAEAQTLNQDLTAERERLTQFKEQHLLCLDTIEQLETKLKALAGAEQHLERVPGHISQNEDDGWCWKDERLARELAKAMAWITEVSVVASKAFALDGCCHWEDVCRGINQLIAERNALGVLWKETVEERERLKVLLDAALESVKRLETELTGVKEVTSKLHTRLNDVLTAHLNGWEYYARPPE